MSKVLHTHTHTLLILGIVRTAVRSNKTGSKYFDPLKRLDNFIVLPPTFLKRFTGNKGTDPVNIKMLVN